MRKYVTEEKIFSARATTITGQAFQVPDFMHLMITLSSQSNANFTVKFQGSQSETQPDFSAARSGLNRWDYIQVRDYQNNAAIDGDTGVSFTGTDDVRLFEMNVNGLRWVCATITAISAGSVNLYFSGYSNE